MLVWYNREDCYGGWVLPKSKKMLVWGAASFSFSSVGRPFMSSCSLFFAWVVPYKKTSHFGCGFCRQRSKYKLAVAVMWTCGRVRRCLALTFPAFPWGLGTTELGIGLIATKTQSHRLTTKKAASHDPNKPQKSHVFM